MAIQIHSLAICDGDGMSEPSAVDHDVLRDIRTYLRRSNRFETIIAKPEELSESLVCQFDSGFYPAAVDEVYLEIVWYENADFNFHYREQYTDGDGWECRWDRRPNLHNSRSHFHPGPDASRDRATDESFATDWRDVLTGVLTQTDERMESFWK